MYYQVRRVSASCDETDMLLDFSLLSISFEKLAIENEGED
jgi:hypothetical protein